MHTESVTGETIGCLSAACILCGHQGFVHVTQRRGTNIVKCSSCGLVRGMRADGEPAGSSGAISTDPKHFKMLIDCDNQWRSTMKRVLMRRLRHLERYSGAPLRNWLEIGPGNGGLGEVLQDNGTFWMAVEIDRDMAQRMQASGKNVIQGNFSEMNMTSRLPYQVARNGGFDIIFFSQVLEHVTAPDDFLKNAFSCLRPGGLVYVDVPNNEGLTSKVRKVNISSSGYGEIVPPHHMIAYGPKTLDKALASAGFHNVIVKDYAYNDETFGLVHSMSNSRLLMRMIWHASRFFGLGGNLVGVGTKPAKA